MRRRAACTAAVASILLLPVAYSQTRNTGMSANRGDHLGVQSTIGDILHHPAFAGFGRLILPWDDRTYDESMRLTRISSLLPYHTHVDPATVAGALNRVIDDAAAGKTVFYRFYFEAQRQQQPKRGNTGLFFFRGRPGAPSRSFPRVAGSPMSAPSTKASPLPTRLAGRVTTRS